MFYGKLGDFVFGWFNYFFILYFLFLGDKYLIFSWYGLKLKVFFVKRIVFCLVRNLEVIEKDNNCIVREGKICYKDVDFDFIVRFV